MFGCFLKYIFSIKQGLSITILIALTLFFAISYMIKREHNKPIILSFYQKFAITTFFSSCALFFKINTAKNGFFARLVDAVFSFAKVFTFNQSVEETLKTMNDNGIKATDAMRIYIVIISAAILFCTAFALFILISKILNDSVVQLKYYFYIKESYLFSEINEKSACLANDIRVKNKHAQIIFAGVNKSELNKEKHDYLNSISGRKVNTTSRPITDFHLKEKYKTNVYLIDEEEKDNVKNGKTVFENNKDSNAIINIFSTLRSAETIIDDIVKDKNNANAKAIINLINPAQIIAYDTLWKHPMFEAAERCGSKTMSVLVVGAGYIGMECAKAAMWCGVMDSFNFKINIVDKEDREKEFDAQFPDFRKNAAKAGIPVDYKFHKADVTTSDFTKVLEKCSDANYIIVAIGDDEITMNTTVAIRKWFVRKAVNEGQYNPEKVPTIIPIIRNSDYNALIKDLEHNKKADNKTKETEEDKEYYTYSIGSNADIYKQNVIDEWVIAYISSKTHIKYNDIQRENNRKNDRPENENIIESKDQDQTRKRSSRASAVHNFYKLKDKGIKTTFKENKDKTCQIIFDLQGEPLTESQISELKDRLYKVEHDRWSIFQLLDGWVPIEQKKMKKLMDNKTAKTHKVYEGMMHATISRYSILYNIGDYLYGDEDKFIENDKMVIDYAFDDMIDDLKKMPSITITDNTQPQERN